MIVILKKQPIYFVWLTFRNLNRGQTDHTFLVLVFHHCCHCYHHITNEILFLRVDSFHCFYFNRLSLYNLFCFFCFSFFLFLILSLYFSILVKLNLLPSIISSLLCYSILPHIILFFFFFCMFYLFCFSSSFVFVFQCPPLSLNSTLFPLLFSYQFFQVRFPPQSTKYQEQFFFLIQQSANLLRYKIAPFKWPTFQQWPMLAFFFSFTDCQVKGVTDLCLVSEITPNSRALLDA